jgi:tRNA dimethylallyltransferase
VTKHLVIVGPTAAGKSALALSIARAERDCEIVSLDSMQVYRGMDIGTAKASEAERSEIAHHLIDVVDAHESWSVARAQSDARAAVREIETRGRRAILVGGTGLYVQAVVDDLTLPGEDLEVRAELERRTSEAGGLLEAWNELRAADPVAAARIDEHNQRRIVRALEVIRITGKPFSSFGTGVFAGAAALNVCMVGVWVPRATLATRIGDRFHSMRDRGLVQEVRALAPVMSRTASQAIGYKELLDAIDNGSSLDEAFEVAIRRTRSFARRQRMWFRRDHRITWIGSGSQNCSSLAAATMACWSASP